MSWARLDDDLPESAKWAPISDAAFRLGIRALCWARKPSQLRKRPGFIPEAMATALSSRPKTVTTKLTQELVNAGAGLHDVGIWIPVEGGWMIHDFQKYGPSGSDPGASDGPLEPSPVASTARSEAARVAGRASADARRVRNGTAQPSNVRSNVAPNGTPNVPRTSPNESFERSSNVGRSSSQDLSQDLPNQDPEPDEENAHSLKICQVVGRAEDAESGVRPCAVPVRDTKRMAHMWHRHAQTAALEFGPFESWPEVRAIAAAFQETWGRADEPRHAGDPRGKLILARFAEGYTAEQMVLAVRRAKFDPHILENPPFQSLATILRDGAQVDKFSSLTALPAKPGDKTPKQPNGGNWRPPMEE